ncbi:MAG: hypothetical protein ABW321_22145 [Polyangiales bacterium]
MTKRFAVGAVMPGTETCDGTLDEDCDTNVDEMCECKNGEQKECGVDVGECKLGNQV